MAPSLRWRKRLPKILSQKGKVTPRNGKFARNPLRKAPTLLTLFKTRTASVFGIDAWPVDVEVDLHKGGMSQNFMLVGMPDTAVRESRERIKSRADEFGLRLSQQSRHHQSGPRERTQRRRGLRPSHGRGHPRRDGFRQPPADSSISSSANFRLMAPSARCAARFPSPSARARKASRIWCCRSRMPPKRPWWKA